MTSSNASPSVAQEWAPLFSDIAAIPAAGTTILSHERAGMVLNPRIEEG
jgi:hypothetical protein